MGVHRVNEDDGSVDTAAQGLRPAAARPTSGGTRLSSGPPPAPAIGGESAPPGAFATITGPRPAGRPTGAAAVGPVPDVPPSPSKTLGTPAGTAGQQPGTAGQQPGAVGQQPGAVGPEPGSVGTVPPGALGTEAGAVGPQPGTLGAPEASQGAPLRWQERIGRVFGRKVGPSLLVGLVLGLVLGVFGAVGKTHATAYASTTTMMIDAPYALAATSTQNEMLELSSLLVKYADLVSTDVIADPVAAKLGLTAKQVLGAVTASANPSTVTLLLPVVATWPKPAVARKLSQTVANMLTTYVELQNLQYHIPAADQFTLKTVDPATAPVAVASSTSKQDEKAVILGVFGLLVGFAVTQLVRSRRRRAA